jgi:hypothetical protein
MSVLFLHFWPCADKTSPNQTDGRTAGPVSHLLGKEFDGVGRAICENSHVGVGVLTSPTDELNKDRVLHSNAPQNRTVYQSIGHRTRLDAGNTCDASDMTGAASQ